MDHHDIDKAEIRLECLKLANHQHDPHNLRNDAEILACARDFAKFAFDEEGGAEVVGITGSDDKKPAP